MKIAVLAFAMILAFVAGVVWANRDRERTFDYAAAWGSHDAFGELDGCASQHPDAVHDVVACMHTIAKTEHFDRVPAY